MAGQAMEWSALTAVGVVPWELGHSHTFAVAPVAQGLPPPYPRLNTLESDEAGDPFTGGVHFTGGAAFDEHKHTGTLNQTKLSNTRSLPRDHPNSSLTRLKSIDTKHYKPQLQSQQSHGPPRNAQPNC